MRKIHTDLEGKRFGSLKVIKYLGPERKGHWLCECDCGQQRTFLGSALAKGNNQSCGCKSLKYPKDLTGITFGRITITGPDDTKGFWRGVCSCGNLVSVHRYRLVDPSTSNSCGCILKELMRLKMTKHGGSKDKLYGVLNALIQRLDNPKSPDYKWYGALGVKLHEPWRDYTVFKAWALSSGYAEGLTIDRADAFGDYTPENCRWITQKEQNSNRRNCLKYR